MTNHWNDLANSDCILIMGSNPAENHPISFKWVLKAQDKGAKVVSVDPRFTHSSSKADFYVQLRVGTDIAFLGGMINYILNNDKYFKQYVIDSTNGPTVVGEQFGFSDGLFSGFNADKKSYDKKTWAFEMDANGVPVRDETLTHPRCVLQLLKKHYDRYTLDKVSETTGTPKEDLLRVYETFASTGAPDKAGTIMYAMGWTQKSVGVQNIRAMSIIQLLLGNIGVAGGGVNALRGESNVQGSTDQALLADIWPGYLPVPNFHADDPRGLQRHHAQDQRSQERELVGQPAQVHGELPHVALSRRDARCGLQLRPAPRRRQEADRLHVDVHL